MPFLPPNQQRQSTEGTATFDNSGNKASSRGAAADLPQSLVVVDVV